MASPRDLRVHAPGQLLSKLKTEPRHLNKGTIGAESGVVKNARFFDRSSNLL